VPERKGWVWDASGFISLLATRRVREILSALGASSYIVKEVRAQEILFIRPFPDDEPSDYRIEEDIRDLMDAGLLTEIELDEIEIERFIGFAAEIDDGEARSMAAAVERGLHLITDDRPAVKLGKSLPRPLTILMTPEWVKRWSDISNPDPSVVTEVIKRIQISARYRPRSSHPLKAWWDRRLE
jgi:hypothetical protein